MDRTTRKDPHFKTERKYVTIAKQHVFLRNGNDSTRDYMSNETIASLSDRADRAKLVCDDANQAGDKIRSCLSQLSAPNSQV
jgi:hypothetical protein